MSHDTIQQIPLDAIIIDPRLQMREEEIDWAFADTLKDALEEDAELQMEPVILFLEVVLGGGGVRYYIGDGHHRVQGHGMAERKTIAAIVHPGGYDAAFKYALGANAEQKAKPRTRADIRKAVTIAIEQLILGRTKADAATQQEVADLCKCSQKTVSNVYKLLTNLKTPKEKPEPKQLDFLEELSGDWSDIPESIKGLLERPYWIDESIPIQKRLQGADLLIGDLKSALKSATAHKTRLLGKGAK